MKIYLAGSFDNQAELREPANRLWQMGHEVVSTWLHETARPPALSTDEFKTKLAIKDMTEVVKADLIILDNRQSSGGKNAEWGIGLAGFQNKLLWLVGQPSNIFHYLADIRFNDWDECFECLGGYQARPGQDALRPDTVDIPGGISDGTDIWSNQVRRP